MGYNFRRGATGANVGLAVSLNDGGTYQAFDFNNSSVTDAGTNGSEAYTNLEAGDFIEIIIYNSDGVEGDQSFGNFTVTVPEPSSSLLLGLGGLALILRRRK